MLLYLQFEARVVFAADDEIKTNDIDGILMSSSGAFIINSTGWTYLIRGKAINKPSHQFFFSER